MKQGAKNSDVFGIRCMDKLHSILYYPPHPVWFMGGGHMHISDAYITTFQRLHHYTAHALVQGHQATPSFTLLIETSRMIIQNAHIGHIRMPHDAYEWRRIEHVFLAWLFFEHGEHGEHLSLVE